MPRVCPCIGPGTPQCGPLNVDPLNVDPLNVDPPPMYPKCEPPSPSDIDSLRVMQQLKIFEHYCYCNHTHTLLHCYLLLDQ